MGRSRLPARLAWSGCARDRSAAWRSDHYLETQSCGFIRSFIATAWDRIAVVEAKNHREALEYAVRRGRRLAYADLEGIDVPRAFPRGAISVVPTCGLPGWKVSACTRPTCEPPC